MELYSPTGKQAQERRTQCKVTKTTKYKKASFREPLTILSSLLKVLIQIILGTPGVNFMVRVSML